MPYEPTLINLTSPPADQNITAWGKANANFESIAEALEITLGALQYHGVWDCSTTAYPTTPSTGDYYACSVEGTISGTLYRVNDWLVYNGATWDKIDNATLVTSVAGRTGAVTLTTADVADSSDKRYCTDAQETVIGNTSGTNSGNETTTTIGSLINGATAKNAPVDADYLGLMDSESSNPANVLKKLSWAYVKSVLKTYFDGLYPATNDSRLSDARTPTSHALSVHTTSGAGDGKLLTASSATEFGWEDPAPTWGQVSGKPSTFAPIIGSGAGDAVAGNDGRLTNARTPVAHNLIDGTGHPVTGLTENHVLKATGATTYGFGALSHTVIGDIGTNSHSTIDSRLPTSTEKTTLGNSLLSSSVTKLGSGAGGNWSSGASTFVGVNAGNAETTAGNSVFVGYEAGKCSTGDYNTVLGHQAFVTSGSGAENCAFGDLSLNRCVGGYNNAAFGRTALYWTTSGHNQTGVGYGALSAATIGNNCSALGSNALSALTDLANCTGLGANTAVTGSSQVQLGNSATTTYAYGAVQGRSDERDKTDIRDTILGLDFINALRPIDFKWDMREDYKPDMPMFPKDATNDEAEQYKLDVEQWLEAVKLKNLTHDGTHKRGRYHHGLIAQEVKAVLNESDIDFGGFQDHSFNDGDDVQSIGYAELIAPLIKTCQQLSVQNTALEARIAALEAK